MKRFELVSHVYQMGTDRRDRGGLFRRAGSIIRAFPKFDLLQPFSRCSDEQYNVWSLSFSSLFTESKLEAFNPFLYATSHRFRLDVFNLETATTNPMGQESNLMIGLVYVIRTGTGR